MKSILTGVLIALAIALSPIARADPNDATNEAFYITMLDKGGVPYDTPAGAVMMGHSVCTGLAIGKPVKEIEHNLMVGGESAGEPD
jgi:hypothetical protein